jgi:anaerobic selenocysteine-containing dehydrogenase
MLISGGRRSASYNTWTHNIPALMRKLKGNWATLSRDDAERVGLREGMSIRIVSKTGSFEIPAVASQEIREGVVMIHQFWGHKYESGMQTSREYPGKNVNELHDDRVRDPFTGMPVFNGTPCRIETVGRD